MPTVSLAMDESTLRPQAQLSEQTTHRPRARWRGHATVMAVFVFVGRSALVMEFVAHYLISDRDRQLHNPRRRNLSERYSEARGVEVHR